MWKLPVACQAEADCGLAFGAVWREPWALTPLSSDTHWRSLVSCWSDHQNPRMELWLAEVMRGNILLGVPVFYTHQERTTPHLSLCCLSKDNGHKSHNIQQVPGSTVTWSLRIWPQSTTRKCRSTFQVRAVLEEVIPLVSFCVRGWHQVVVFIFQILQVRVDHCNSGKDKAHQIIFCLLRMLLRFTASHQDTPGVRHLHWWVPRSDGHPPQPPSP